MHRFYVPNIATDNILPEEESRHCVRVLRLREGDAIEVVDGRGTLYRCEITAADIKHCVVNILDSVAIQTHWGCKITLAIAPTKNIDRIEWLAEKVTEMGIDRIVPLLCRYSERKVLKTERLEKILVSAMKQSLKATLPLLDELTPITDFIKNAPAGQRFIAYCDQSVPRKDFVHEYKQGEDATILIGPEGDFSQEEIRKSIDAGFVPVSLGDSRLRTETAGLFAVAAIHTINQQR